MTHPESHRLLAAILDVPEPCGHIERLVRFVADQAVRIVPGDGEMVLIDCQLCEVIIPFDEFSRLVMGAMQERN
jgi:hypothetical protein